MSSGLSSVIKAHLAGGASRLASLLLPQILPVFSVVAPRQPGAALRDLGLVHRGPATRVPPKLLASHARRSRVRQASVIPVGLIAAFAVDPDRPLPFDVCGFRYLLGFPCPTCGLTRALCHALHGDWAVSIGYHPVGILLAAALTGWMLWSMAEAVRGQPMAEVARGRLRTSMLGVGIVSSIAAWVVRFAG